MKYGRRGIIDSDRPQEAPPDYPHSQRKFLFSMKAFGNFFFNGNKNKTSVKINKLSEIPRHSYCNVSSIVFFLYGQSISVLFPIFVLLFLLLISILLIVFFSNFLRRIIGTTVTTKQTHEILYFFFEVSRMKN